MAANGAVRWMIGVCIKENSEFYNFGVPYPLGCKYGPWTDAYQQAKIGSSVIGLQKGYRAQAGLSYVTC